jgi:hypothetical protein
MEEKRMTLRPVTKTLKYYTDVEQTKAIGEVLAVWIEMHENIHEISIKPNLANFTIFVKFDDEVEGREWD